MKVCAVICELNPLHKGHQALFAHAKSRFGGLVCVLSGNFVQRGEPAILDKWARARLALESGADLVLELPLPWALAGAERFAAGGVALARALGLLRPALVGALSDPDLAARITDEASAIEALGHQPRLVPGDFENFKLTWPGDFALAARLLATVSPA